MSYRRLGCDPQYLPDLDRCYFLQPCMCHVLEANSLAPTRKITVIGWEECPCIAQCTCQCFRGPHGPLLAFIISQQPSPSMFKPTVLAPILTALVAVAAQRSTYSNFAASRTDIHKLIDRDARSLYQIKTTREAVNATSNAGLCVNNNEGGS